MILKFVDVLEILKLLKKLYLYPNKECHQHIIH
jgi:hypothetical protein